MPKKGTAYLEPNKVLDSASKFFRIMAKEGVDFNTWSRICDDKEKRARLRDFVNAGCPESGQRALATLNPHEYFVTRPGLNVWDDFTERILSAAKPAKAPNVKLASYDLPCGMTNTEIREEFGKSHVFEDAGKFCTTLAQMIDAQWGGKDGELLNNGYANIFYVRGAKGEVFVILVCWHSDFREWDVNARWLDDRRWGQGRRAFSRNF